MILIFPMTLRDHLLVNMGNMALWVESPRQWESDVLWTFNECLYEVRSSYRGPLDVQRTSDTHCVITSCYPDNFGCITHGGNEDKDFKFLT